MRSSHYEVEPIGFVRSELTRLKEAPMQGDEGAPYAWLELTPLAGPGLLGIQPADELLVLTWLHLARRDVLQVHPRGDLNRPLTGVFATRSPRRPSPIGLTVVQLLRRDGRRLHVRGVDMLDATPVLDIKPYLSSVPAADIRRGWLAAAEERRRSSV